MGSFFKFYLFAVFKVGEYEDGIDNNSTFAEGDWNGDGDFDSGDLVAAFQAGTFLRAARYADIASAIATVVDEMQTMSDRERIDQI